MPRRTDTVDKIYCALQEICAGIKFLGSYLSDEHPMHRRAFEHLIVAYTSAEGVKTFFRDELYERIKEQYPSPDKE